MKEKIFQSEVVRSENEFTHKSELLENKLINIVKKMYKLKGIIEEEENKEKEGEELKDVETKA